MKMLFFQGLEIHGSSRCHSIPRRDEGAASGLARTRILCGLLLALPLVAAAGPTLETRLWYADNGQDAALVGGVEGGFEPITGWRVTGRYDEGRFNPGGDVETASFARGLLLRSAGPYQIGAGYAWLGFATELQPDWTWSYPAEEQERNADAHGPVLHARGEARPAGGPWRFHAAGTWLVHDFGAFDDLGYDGAHVDLDAGLSYVTTRWQAGLGYRWLRFRDLPPRVSNERRYQRNQTDGAYVHLTFTF